MKSLIWIGFLSFVCITLCSAQSPKTISLFNGKNFQGWEGDTLHTWHIEKGIIIGGSLENTVPHNDFLCSQKVYSNFILKLKIKLTGEQGFINSGVQFRSKRLSNPAYEMIGYQADFGKNYWASLYDESRRNKTLVKPNDQEVLTWIKFNDWNEYEIKAINNQIRLYINGHMSVDYTEVDSSIPQSGLIGIQIHGGGKAQVAVKDIMIQELP